MSTKYKNQSIKELRNNLQLTQEKASKITGIPLRTYKNYENDPSKAGSIKHNHILQVLSNYKIYDEDHGIHSIDSIQTICADVFKKYDIDYCILFGSYAVGKAGEKSDIDLIVSTKITGLKFFGLAEDLRISLGKKVDVLDTRQLKDNINLMDAVLKEGIKIYER